MNNIIKRVWNQNRLVNIEDLTGAAFQAEADGHTFEISGIDDTGAAVELSGTVAGVFRRPDNADIALTGSASEGVVSVTLSEDCYAVPGRFGLTIFVTSNSQKVAVYACVGTVAVSSTGNVAGDTPASVEDLLDAIDAAIADLNTAIGSIPADYSQFMAAIAPAYSSSALYAVGSYAWYDGSLYRCITAITTAEAWTAAHWTVVALGDDVSDLKSALDHIAIIETETTDYQIEIDNTSPSVVFRTNNINEKTSLALGVSKGNIIKLPYFRPNNYTTNGLTFTINSDGSITVNGTATADTTYNIAYYNTNVLQFSRLHPVQGRQYGWTLSGCTDGSDSTYFLKDVGSGITCKTGPAEVWGTGLRSAMNLVLVLKSGVTLTDKTFYPMASLTGQEEFTPPIPVSDQYTATVESSEESYTWPDAQLHPGYNLIVGNFGNTITAFIKEYETISNIQNEINELKQVIGNHWKGKKWVAFGTSITDNYSQNSYITQGEHAGEHTGKYVPYLLDMSELSSSAFVNRGVSGGSINGHILYYIRYYTSDEANADLITIEGAVNDFATSVPLGQVGDTVPYTNGLLPDSTAEGTFAGACYQAFTTALTNAPNAVVVMLTETTGKDHTGYANYSQLRKNSLDLTQWDYIDMTIKVARFVGIPVIMCGQDSMINAQNPQYIADHIHHTYLGGYQYAKTIWSKLKGIPLKATEVPE